MTTALTTHRPRTLAAVFRPEIGSLARVGYELLLLAAGVMLIAVSARIQIPMVPVPFTMQTFAVLLVGAAYGSVRGGATILAYLAAGAAGAPVFASGVGFGIFAGPAGGYLFGFLIGAVLVGFLAERGWDRRVVLTLLAMTLGTACIFGTAIVWYLALGMSLNEAVSVGVSPYLRGAAIKIALAAAVLPFAWMLLRR